MPNMYVKRVILDHEDFTINELINGEITINLRAYVMSPDLKTAGNDLLNRVYEISQELHKFTSTYVEPVLGAPTVRPRSGSLLKNLKKSEIP